MADEPTGEPTPAQKKKQKRLDPPPLDEVSPLTEFFHQDYVAAFILLGAALLALIISNSPWHYAYDAILHEEFTIGFGDGMLLSKTLHHWINDGLMAVFFFLVGLEIKREVLVGELASFRKALLPAAAAAGGMVVPALVYAIINFGGEGAHGWGIPMATDIAFAMGCIAILGGRVPAALAVFLVALAIVDDLGAVLVIALFYTGGIDTQPLVIGFVLIIASFIIAKLGVRNALPYALIGILLWLAFLMSGVHATIAGVLLAFTIPADARYSRRYFSDRIRELIARFDKDEQYDDRLFVNADQQHIIRKMTRECHYVEAPLQRIEHNLHPLSVFIIMPIFAFANSGVQIPFAEAGSLLFRPVTLGIICGLLIGKPLGIMLFSFIAVKLNLAELPKGIQWKQLAGVGMLAGIGFTMSLFINELAFTSGGHGVAHAATETAADFTKAHILEGKVGIFVASILAGVIGLLYLRAVCPAPPPGAASNNTHH